MIPEAAPAPPASKCATPNIVQTRCMTSRDPAEGQLALATVWSRREALSSAQRVICSSARPAAFRQAPPRALLQRPAVPRRLNDYGSGDPNLALLAANNSLLPRPTTYDTV